MTVPTELFPNALFACVKPAAAPNHCFPSEFDIFPLTVKIGIGNLASVGDAMTRTQHPQSPQANNNIYVRVFFLLAFLVVGDDLVRVAVRHTK